MTYTDIVTKLIGPINPVGETNTDNERHKNLMAMCELIDNLVSDVDAVFYKYKDAQEFSVKRASKYAENFLYFDLINNHSLGSINKLEQNDSGNTGTVPNLRPD